MNSVLTTSFFEWLEFHCGLVNNSLDKKLPKTDGDLSVLHEAMRYACLGGGKRVRPALIYAVGEKLPLDEPILNDISMIIEIIHSYSLVHDDLPAMDDDDFRRGELSCHRVYGEGMAVLVGDSLQALAFEWLSKINLSDTKIVKLCHILSQAIGPFGMAQGQSLDLEFSKSEDESYHQLDNVKTIHQLKTGQLFLASTAMTLQAADQYHEKHPLLAFIRYVGMAFQIQDDILDIVGKEERIGKPVGSDQKENKLTYPKVIGLESSIKDRDKYYEMGVKQLKNTPWETGRLGELSHYMIYSE